MTRLVVTVARNPYRPRRAEYSLQGLAVEAQLPAAPLLEDPHTRGLILVEDRYAAHPATGALPGATSYGELLEALESYMERSCSRRLPPGLCGRTSWRAVPSTGEHGAWRFNAAPGDTLLAATLHVLEHLLQAKPPAKKIVLVLDPEAAIQPQLAAMTAAAAAAAATGAGLEAYAAPPHPSPEPRRPPLLELQPHPPPRLTPREPPPREARLLEPRPPAGPPRLPRTVERAATLTLASAGMASNCMLLPLLYQACGARDPAGKLHTILRSLWSLYTEATILRKKRVGGTVHHGYTASHQALQALAAGTAAEAAALQALAQTGQSCDQLYKQGAPARTLEQLGKTIGCPCDTTPATCTRQEEGVKALREGCLKRLREQAASTG